MSYYKIEKQNLEQNLNDVLQMSDTSSSQTIAKPIVGGSFVYAFQYCYCIYESSFCTISIHRSYKNAYNRMKKHKIEAFNDWFSRSKWAKSRFKFGETEKWHVKKIKIEDDWELQ